MKRTYAHLTVEQVVAIHERMIAEYGGAAGIRDRGLLVSAVAMPASQFGGRALHRGIAAMAAAYLFHLCRNHAFFDGNKRTALASASVFLLANGSRLAASQAQKLALVMSVAAGEVGKADVLKFFRRHVRPRGRNPGRRAGMPGHGS